MSQRQPKIAVIGNGIMGHGIAEVFAASGHEVVLTGRSMSSLEQALENMRISLAGFVKRGLLGPDSIDTVLARVTTSVDIGAVQEADLIIEALPEDMELKRQTFQELDAICASSTILATASGHPASGLAEGLIHPNRVIAAHFWYPPQLLPLVEVCGGPKTAPEVVTRTCDMLIAAGKEPVVIDKEVDGFIGNRIQFAALREAWSLWSAGVASAAAIDAVVRNSIGRRYAVTGPIESADLGGLPVMVNFAAFLQPSLAVDAGPSEKLRELSELEGGTVHGRSAEEMNILLEARREELFRWLAADHARD